MPTPEVTEIAASASDNNPSDQQVRELRKYADNVALYAVAQLLYDLHQSSHPNSSSTSSSNEDLELNTPVPFVGRLPPRWKMSNSQPNNDSNLNSPKPSSFSQNSHIFFAKSSVSQHTSNTTDPPLNNHLRNELRRLSSTATADRAEAARQRREERTIPTPTQAFPRSP